MPDIVATELTYELYLGLPRFLLDVFLQYLTTLLRLQHPDRQTQGSPIASVNLYARQA